MSNSIRSPAILNYNVYEKVVRINDLTSENDQLRLNLSLMEIEICELRIKLDNMSWI